MKTRIIATLAIITAFISIKNPVNAQTPTAQRPTAQSDFTLRGDSLVNVNQRSAEDDFKQFFNQPNRGNANNLADQDISSDVIPVSGSIPISNTPLIIQPATQTVNGNDGLQLQLDLTASPER